MIGLGTIINFSAVILGGIIGILFKKGINEQIQKTLMQACGVAVIFIGISGTLEHMLIISDNSIQVQGTMLLIFSLVIGTIIGELLKIEQKMDNLGTKIKKIAKRENDSLFVDGFVNVSLIICVGAMAIVGSIQDGINGDYSMLVAKSILDCIIVMVFASTYGIGAAFAAIPILLYQGAITLIAAFAGSFVSDQLLADLSFIGSALIFCVGVNVAFGKKFKVASMLPAILIPVFRLIILGLS